MTELPVKTILPRLRQALEEHHAAILTAQPGAGKTTVIPLALRSEPWLKGNKIIMLEPRRLAARSAAAYMARTLGESAGGTVGYRVRMDTRVSEMTKVEVVTEGVLTRMLQHDPALEGVGLVIFDEYHERNLHADLGLALTRQCQEVLRPDLKILVMSATLDAEPLSRLLNGAPILESPGRTYPVETVYAPKRPEEELEQAMARTIQEAMRAYEGDVLAFLPGIREIRRTERELGQLGLPGHIRVAAIYGTMPLDQQDEAIRPSAVSERKIVLATSIAESSLTIEGISIVVDSGLQREPSFSARTGMSRLITVRISKASAVQRQGRAGRLRPGVGYRLWSAEEQAALPEFSRPEIQAADLVPLALELAAWGAKTPSELQWLDQPPAAAYEQAVQLLELLGCIDYRGITEHGRRVHELGIHPRLGHMLLESRKLGLEEPASRLAALLQERDLFRASLGTDLRLRMDILEEQASGNLVRSSDIPDREALERLIRESRHWLNTVTADSPRRTAGGRGSDDCGILLAFAYPDRIGQSRGGGKFLLSSGRGAFLPGQELMSGAAYVVVAEADDQGSDGRIRLAAPLTEQELYSHHRSLMKEEELVYWDQSRRGVRAEKKLKVGAVTLKELPYERPSYELVAAALLEGIRRQGIQLLPWSKQSRQLQERMIFMHQHLPEWPDASDQGLLDTLEEWLLPYLSNQRSAADLQRLHIQDLLLGLLSWEQRQQLDQEAPTHVQVPSGSRIPVDYSRPDAPTLAVRLQELFGMRETPRLGLGSVPVLLHLLSPAQRPVQVTSDLESFWEHAYFEVKKDLKGRYPKHYWPDNPLEAMPTRRVKPRS
ncbi:ATP-dependent helicase HrpB [Paenibacillus sp. JX-17]|uniref:ATP-dependent helicase HrpB n=1 Tax=Paenibacillus lacisoli TaxID=3064525 RepID=A0ABT9CDE9_9BACL|nr:ATP-dependent helicase HrpB [Paenibacillus sp. JX-17]MDO7905711.1 ATP-dependent helicase HrpB [Paenibacillus sp. JX-17]